MKRLASHRASMDETKPTGIEIGQIAVERVSFRHREDYLTVPVGTSVGSLPLRIKSGYTLSSDASQAAIRVELSTDETQRPLYMIEAVVVGLVRVKEGQANMPLERYAAFHGVVMLFPFLRELVANLTGRGRFGPVWLHPVNLAAALKRESTPGNTEIVAKPRAASESGGSESTPD